MCVYAYLGLTRRFQKGKAQLRGKLAFTRGSFTSRLMRTNQSFVYPG